MLTNSQVLKRNRWLRNGWKSSVGIFTAIQISEVLRSFTGAVTVRVRTTVGHDSYERLVDVQVSPDDYWIPAGLTGASPISDPIKEPRGRRSEQCLRHREGDKRSGRS